MENKKYGILARFENPSALLKSAEKVRDFGYWLMRLPKISKSANNNPRSPEVVNNCITTIMQMYRDVGVRDGYISSDKVPVIDKLSQKNDGTLKTAKIERYIVSRAV